MDVFSCVHLGDGFELLHIHVNLVRLMRLYDLGLGGHDVSPDNDSIRCDMLFVVAFYYPVYDLIRCDVRRGHDQRLSFEAKEHE